MNYRNLLLGASCLAIVSAGHATAQTVSSQTPADPTAQAQAQAQASTVDDVIVTASRRSESLKEVPTAVSAYGAAMLRDAQVASLSDLATVTPNVQISSYGTTANVSVRGIGSGSQNFIGGDPGVAVHQNGVYLSQASLALSTFLDVQRVEILRGPQGTLFGRNSTGGAINIIPNAPTADLSYGVDISAGLDPAMLRSSAYVSGPLNGSGNLQGRFAAGQNYNGGFTRNAAPDGPSRLDDNRDYSARGQLLWTPSDTFKLLLSVEYQDNADNGPGVFLLGTPGGGPIVFPDPLNPITLAPDFPRGDAESRVAYNNVGSRDRDATTVNLIADWAMGGGALTATLSYNESHNQTVQDGDGTAVEFTYNDFTLDADQTYGELIYTSDPSRPFTYVIGANYFEEHAAQDVLIPISGYSVLFPIYFSSGTVDTESYAAFAHGQYEIGDTKVFAGVRYSHDAKDVYEFFNLRPIFTGGLPTSQTGSASWSDVSYEVGVSRDFSRSLTGYAKYATGYKGGGYSISSFNPAYEPETNANIEIGLKGSFFDGRLQSNLAAFHMTYENLQVLQIQGVASAIRNAAEATVNGVEVESVLHPTDTLRIEVSGAWLDGKFDEFLTQDSSRPALGTLDLAGNQLPNSPRYSATVGVFQDFALPAGALTLGGRYAWKSRLYFSEFNTAVASQEEVGKLDLFVNYKSRDGLWTASLFALNVTDEAVKSNVLVISDLLGSLALGQYQPARQVGVSLGYHF